MIAGIKKGAGMLIRSQNKKSLYNLNANRGIYIRQHSKCQEIIGDGLGSLGIYSTEEKAIKVLDRIEESYIGTCYTDTEFDGQNIHNVIIANNVVFQMPQDEEV